MRRVSSSSDGNISSFRLLHGNTSDKGAMSQVTSSKMMPISYGRDFEACQRQAFNSRSSQTLRVAEVFIFIYHWLPSYSVCSHATSTRQTVGNPDHREPRDIILFLTLAIYSSFYEISWQKCLAFIPVRQD